MPQTIDQPPEIDTEEDAERREDERGGEEQELSPKEMAEQAIEGTRREHKDYRRETEGTRKTVESGSSEERTRVHDIDTRAEDLVAETEKGIRGVASGGEAESVAAERGAEQAIPAEVPEEFKNIFEEPKIQQFFDDLNLAELSDTGLLGKKFQEVFDDQDLCKRLGIDPQNRSTVVDSYFRDIVGKAEQYVLKVAQEAAQVGEKKIEEKFLRAMGGGALFAVVRRGAELALKVGTTATIPAKMGIGAIAGAINAGLYYKAPQLWKRRKGTEVGRALKKLEGNEEARGRILEQLQTDLTFHVGADRDRQKNLAEQARALDGLSDEDAQRIFSGAEGDHTRKRDDFLDLVRRTEGIGTQSGEKKKQSIQERQELIKKLTKDGTISEYVTHKIQEALQDQLPKEKELSRQEKLTVFQQVHLLVERQMNTILGDVVAQEQFGEIDAADKKSFARTYVAKIMGNQPPETFMQAILRGGAYGAVSGLVNTDAVAGAVYMGTRAATGAFRQEMMGRREQVVKTSREVVAGLQKGVQGVEAGDVDVAQARQLIRDARARIKLPDMKEADRARIEAHIHRLETAAIIHGVHKEVSEENRETMDDLIARLAGETAREGAATTARAAELAEQERKGKSLRGLGGEYWKLSPKERWQVAGRVAKSAGIGIAGGLLGGQLAGDIMDGNVNIVGAAHAAEVEPDSTSSSSAEYSPHDPHAPVAPDSTGIPHTASPDSAAAMASALEAAGVDSAAAEPTPEQVRTALGTRLDAQNLDDVVKQAFLDQLDDRPTLEEAEAILHQFNTVKSNLNAFGVSNPADFMNEHPELIQQLTEHPEQIIHLQTALRESPLPERMYADLLNQRPELLEDQTLIREFVAKLDATGLNKEWQYLLAVTALEDPSPEGLQDMIARAEQVGAGLTALDITDDARDALITDNTDVAEAIIQNPDLLHNANQALDAAGVPETSQGELVLAHPELIQHPEAATDMAARFDRCGVPHDTMAQLLTETQGDLSTLDDVQAVELLTAGFDATHPGLGEQGFTVAIAADGQVQVTVELGENGALGKLEQIYSQLGGGQFARADLVDDNGELSDVGAAKMVNVANNLTQLTEGKGLSSLRADFESAGVSFEDGNLTITDFARFDSVVDALVDRANVNEEALMKGAVAYIDNYSQETQDRLVALNEAKEGSKLVAPSFSGRESVTRVEQELGNAPIEKAFGDSVDRNSIHVIDENTASFDANGQHFEIKGGHIVSVGDVDGLSIDVTHFHADDFVENVQGSVFESQVAAIAGDDASEDHVAAMTEVAGAIHEGHSVLSPTEVSLVTGVSQSEVTLETLRHGGDAVDADLARVVGNHPEIKDTQAHAVADARDTLYRIAPSTNTENVYRMVVQEQWHVVPHPEDQNTVMMFNARNNDGLNLHAVGGRLEATYAPEVASAAQVAGAEVIQSPIEGKPLAEPMADVSQQSLTRAVNAIELRADIEREFVGDVDVERRDSGVLAMFRREMQPEHVQKLMTDVTLEQLQNEEISDSNLAKMIGTNQVDDVREVREFINERIGSWPMHHGMKVGEAVAQVLADQAATELESQDSSLRATESRDPSMREGAQAQEPSLRAEGEAIPPTPAPSAAPASTPSPLRGGAADEAISPPAGTLGVAGTLGSLDDVPPEHRVAADISPEAEPEPVAPERAEAPAEEGERETEVPGVTLERRHDMILARASDDLGDTWTMDKVEKSTDSQALQELRNEMTKVLGEAKKALGKATDEEKATAQDLVNRAEEVMEAVNERVEEIGRAA